MINNTFDKSPTNHPQKDIKASSKRTILKKNTTAALGDNSGYDLLNQLTYHANRRVDLFFLDCVLRANTFKHTSKAPKNLTHIGPTKFQALVSKKEKHHGSHSNTGAIYDKTALELIEYLGNNQAITPELKDLLFHFGFTEQDIPIIQTANKDSTAYKNIIAKAKNNRSFIAGSHFEMNTNLTVALPRDSNLIIDKTIETYIRRNFLTQTMTEVITGRITPIEATKKYVDVIRICLTNFKKSLQDFEFEYDKIKAAINICAEIEKKQKVELSDLEKYRHQIEVIKQTITILKTSGKPIQLGLPSLKRILRSLTPRKTKKPLSNEEYSKRTKKLWSHNVGFSLNEDTCKEIKDISSRIVLLQQMVQQQIYGTSEPNYELLLRLEGGGIGASEQDVQNQFIRK